MIAFILALQAIMTLGFFVYGIYHELEADKLKAKLEACEATQPPS